MSASDSFVPKFYAEAAAVPRRRGLRAKEFYRYTVSIAERVGDALACMAGVMCACRLESLRGALTFHAPQDAAAAALFIGMLATLLLHSNGAYQAAGNLLRIRETEHAIRVPVQLALLFSPLSFAPGAHISIRFLLVCYAITTLLLVIEKQIAVSLMQWAHVRGLGVEDVIIYGAGEPAFHLVSTLLSCTRFGLRPVAAIAGRSTADRRLLCACGERPTLPVYPGPVTAALLRELNARTVIVAEAQLSTESRAQVTEAAEQAGMRISVLSDAEDKCNRGPEVVDIDALPWQGYDRPSCMIGKRLVDILLSSLLLALLAPLMLLIPLLIRADSAGPAFFVQRRVGKDGAYFNMWKFRSMYTTALPYEHSPVRSHDARITRIGRLLRKTSLDELPQLINVLRGEMSLVGPRPEMPFIVDNYSPHERKRLRVAPGITGLWQLSPYRSQPIHHNLRFDLFYIRQRTFFMDIAILLHTALFAMRGI